MFPRGADFGHNKEQLIARGLARSSGGGLRTEHIYYGTGEACAYSMSEKSAPRILYHI